MSRPARLIHRSARTLARLVADVKATTDCQIVVIGGSVGLAEGYLALVEHYLAQEPWPITWNYWRRITVMTLDYWGPRCWPEENDDDIR